MQRPFGVAVVACCCALAPAAASGATVDAGAIGAQTTADPWHLVFAQPRGPTLSEHSGTGPGPTGTLGFSTGDVWRHATRVVSESTSGGAYTAELATTDPLRRLRVRIERASAGAIRVRASVVGAAAGVDRMGIAFGAPAGERHLGFGERSNAVDQRGNTVENYVSDGPYQTEERPFIAAFVPPPGFHPRDDATYFPMPWLLSTRGYGFLLDGFETNNFRLGTDQAGAWSAEVDGAAISFRVFAGPRPAGALRRMSAAVGRQPRAAAPFFLGPWFQPSDGDEQSIRRLRRADAPASVANTYTHYLPCGAQQGNTKAERARTKLFHDSGIAVTTYFNPMICTEYQPVWDRAVAQDVVTKDALGRPYTYKYTGSTVFLVGQMDFTAPRAQAFWSGLLSEAVRDGYDGWMEDFGEYTPADARSADGTPGARMHNRYVVLYHRDAHDYSRTAPRPLARFNRSGFTGAARHSEIVWGGDPTTSWGFDGLRSAVYQGLTMGLSGVSLWGSDIGGFFSLGENELTPELLVRWIEMGMASGVMRTEANGFDLPPKDRPQILDPGVLPTWRRYAKLRTQLYPYLSAADRRYRRTGMPIMRHLALAFPGDRRAAARDDEYMLGPDLLVAPVVEEGARTRSVYLPRGRWVDLWRSARFRSKAGALQLGRARVIRGGRTVTVPAPLAQLPLFVRAGATIPLLPADVDTLTGYGEGRELVHLSDRRDRRRLLAFPGASRRWTLRLHSPRRTRFRLAASLLSLRPCSVAVGGRELRRWSFDRKARVLRARFTARSNRLTVTGCS
ncbi:MAG TPA: TIM-barrel domain-containing protein [Thermoleophilaceae bacterium]|nr:TIM-barrel domain-containing protein [Thermoleophilaceae bacterium]